MNIPEQDLKILQEHLDKLAEHFDSVRIMVTRCEAGELGATIAINLGNGNVYASLQQAREWLIENDHRTRLKAEADFEENDFEETE